MGCAGHAVSAGLCRLKLVERSFQSWWRRANLPQDPSSAAWRHFDAVCHNMEVSYNGDTPKWMIWGYPHFRKPPCMFLELDFSKSWHEIVCRLNMTIRCLGSGMTRSLICCATCCFAFCDTAFPSKQEARQLPFKLWRSGSRPEAFQGLCFGPIQVYGSRPKTPERFLVKDLFSHFSHGLKPASRKFRARAAQGTRKYYCYHYYKYYF